MNIGAPTVLNLIPGGIIPIVYVNQYDKGYEKRFFLYKGAEPFNIADNMSVTIRGTKGDDHGIIDSVSTTVGSNLVSVTLTEQMTAVKGIRNVYELRIVDTNDLLVGTVNFILAVEPSSLDDGTIISDSDLSYAEDVYNRLQSVEAFKNQLDAASASIVDLKKIVINIMDYGAVGDGATDDSATINRCIAMAEEYQRNGYNSTVLLPKKHLMLSPITLGVTYQRNAFITISGIGRESTLIHTTDIALFTAAENNHYNFLIKDLNISYPDGNAFTTPCITDYKLANSYFKNCIFRNIPQLIYASVFAQSLKFFECRFIGGTGSLLKGRAFIDCHFDECYISSRSGIILEQSVQIGTASNQFHTSEVQFTQCTVEDCDNYFAKITDGGLQLLQCYIEDLTGGIEINITSQTSGGTTTAIRTTPVIVSQCKINFTNASDTPVVEMKTRLCNLVFEKNVLRGCYPIDFNTITETDNVGYVYIKNNDYRGRVLYSGTLPDEFWRFVYESNNYTTALLGDNPPSIDVSNRLQIPANTSGLVRITDASESPTGTANQYFGYTSSVQNNGDRRTLILYQSSNNIYVCTYVGSTWSQWKHVKALLYGEYSGDLDATEASFDAEYKLVAGCTNTPSANISQYGGCLRVTRFTSNRILQECWSSTGVTYYQRFYYGSWGTWKQITLA